MAINKLFQLTVSIKEKLMSIHFSKTLLQKIVLYDLYVSCFIINRIQSSISIFKNKFFTILKSL
ncbi:hypothetical protein FF021_19935 [Leptospira noguchii]|nr:hypothetical protein LEP1GSC041_3407 [Leptospira noguchii str. 2006001870]TQE64189.1 hypothetical protein FF021_19935 [Leptospira noguchii]